MVRAKYARTLGVVGCSIMFQSYPWHCYIDQSPADLLQTPANLHSSDWLLCCFCCLSLCMLLMLMLLLISNRFLLVVTKKVHCCDWCSFEDLRGHTPIGWVWMCAWNVTIKINGMRRRIIYNIVCLENAYKCMCIINKR